ncbi:histone-lysine N-methyltransferase family member SUVH9-like [Impatiens glandulifera]|uniref:histone-lysine N-methyltransferase family member SUVH9-like n=1 Tax=Impatiens glandulifera TaxID=253017 RepID=UPI001FB14332|nr:histone-lysine N-methyltransferase family member SUVH9-like [Impatiens glandulifera]
MSSPVPFQDLNLIPYNIASTSSSNSVTGSTQRPLIVPKLEPKHEPLDETLPLPPARFQFSQSPNPNLSFDYRPNVSLPQQSISEITAFEQIPENLSDESFVYSEFNRISEMFRTAVANGMQNNEYAGTLNPESGAIVPIEDENQLSIVSPRKRYQKRSSELVRVTNLGIEDERYFRDIVRKTRMMYDCLRILATSEEEKRHGPGSGRRARGDLRAATVMRGRGLWLNRDKRIVGSIPGVLIGDLFFFRMELCVVGLHGQIQAGIDCLSASLSPNGEPIATSIIVSGGYEDDEDSGDVLIYTGQGGQDSHHRQCLHQKLQGGNLGLERSMNYGIEIRVIRGFKYEGSPNGKVYVYDGLYRIVETWFDVGKSGFGVYKYKLIRIENQPESGSAILKFAQSIRNAPLSARPTGYQCLDISSNKEKVPVLLFNDIDDNREVAYFDYIPRTIFPAVAYSSMGSSNGCDCVNGCSDNCVCAMKNGGEFAYDLQGILVKGKPLVYECGPKCNCPPNCRNRVSQRGVKYKLEVFRSRETGWGVRSLDLIQAGSFICEYAGVVLTKEQAQIMSMNGDSSLIHPSRFSERWAEWGDFTDMFSDYARPTHPCTPKLDFVIDVSKMRNVACYMSHSTCPNVMVQFVLYNHNSLYYPNVMLFAMENIPPLRELSLDYGVAEPQAEEWEEKFRISN